MQLAALIATICVPLAVFFAAVCADKMRTRSLHRGINSTIEKYKDTIFRTTYLLGSISQEGDMPYTYNATHNSLMTVQAKLFHISREIENLNKTRKRKFSKSEEMILIALMLLPSWSDPLMTIIQPDEMPDDLPPRRELDKKVYPREVKLGEYDGSNIVAVLNPRSYQIIALPNGRLMVKDGDIKARKEKCINPRNPNYGTLEEAIKAMCDHHNKEVALRKQADKGIKAASARLAAELEKWNAKKYEE